MAEMHLDRPITDEEFWCLEQQVHHMSDEDLARYLQFLELLSLEGARFGDGCAGCMHQEQNGARAAALVRAELSRRP
jgi:hypothetical protein